MPRLHTYSQHFLSSPQLVAELIGHSDLQKGDLVYDLGAGSGVITATLSGRVRQVVAVELEPAALAKLQANTADLPNVTIVKSDILDVPSPSEPYKLFSNIPFSLSAPILRHFCFSPRPPCSIYFIVQKQFARKLVPGRDHFTALLGAEIGALYQARIRRPLKRTDFTPPPGVDTVLLELKLRDTPLISLEKMSRYREFVALCFSRQKFFTSLDRAAAGISPELRPSQLSLEQWVDLFNAQR